MPNVQLTWAQGAGVGLLLFALAVGLGRAARPRLRTLAPFAREAAVIAGLYALWQLAGSVAEHGSRGAFARARWIERVQSEWHLPSERGLQHLLLSHPWLGQGANVYYATMHFGALFALLLWVFWRHRKRYAVVRTTVVAFTGVALIVQLVPVAPPRLLPEYGFTDVAAHYGQSVYGAGGTSVDQLSAMPSVHVGWAVLVGAVVVWLGTGPWRYLALVHPVATVYVVTATANHWWLDAVAAVGLLALVAGLQRGWYAVHRPAARSSSDPAPAAVPVG